METPQKRWLCHGEDWKCCGPPRGPTASKVGRRDDGLLDPQAPKIGREARPDASTLESGVGGELSVGFHALDQGLVAGLFAQVVEIAVLLHPLRIRQAGLVGSLERFERRLDFPGK